MGSAYGFPIHEGCGQPLPQATIDYCLNCLPLSSPVRHNIFSLIFFCTSLLISLIHQILLDSSLSSHGPSFLFLLFSLAVIPPSSSFYFNLQSALPSSPLFSILLPVISFLSSLFYLATNLFFPILSFLSCYQGTSPFLTLLSFQICYRTVPSFLYSLF